MTQKPRVPQKPLVVRILTIRPLPMQNLSLLMQGLTILGRLGARDLPALTPLATQKLVAAQCLPARSQATSSRMGLQLLDMFRAE